MTSAVRHSAGMPMARPGKVFVYSKTKNLPKIMTECIHGGLDVIHVTEADRWPPQCHLYVTKAALTDRVWRAAHAMSPVAPVILPEATGWLRGKITELTLAGQDVYIFLAGAAGERL